MMAVPLAGLFLCLFSPSSSPVRLNEIHYENATTQAIELINTASSAADISGWYIDDSGGQTYYTIPPETSIPASGCAVFSAQLYLNKSSSDTVRLFTSDRPPTDTQSCLIDSHTYASLPENGNALARFPDGAGDWVEKVPSAGYWNDGAASCLAPSPTPSPFAPPSPQPTPTPYPTTETSPSSSPISPTVTPIDPDAEIMIYISELYAYPETGQREWLELYNPHERAVTLSHWTIDDTQDSGSAPQSFSLTIEPNTHKLIYISGSVFNNSGDMVRLINPHNTEMDRLEYVKVRRGLSIARTDPTDEAQCEQPPTPDAPNLPCPLATDIPSPGKLPTGPLKNTPSSNQKGPSSQQYSTVAKKYTSSMATYFTPTQSIPSVQSPLPQVLGETSTIQTQVSTRQIPLLLVSALHSILTMVSLFIRMKNA